MSAQRFARYKSAVIRELEALGVEVPESRPHALEEMFIEGIPPREAARRVARPRMLPGPARERSLRAERARLGRRKER
jgi:hypothetical protein